MILKKSSVIAAFRIFSTLFVVTLLFIFLKVAYSDNERLSYHQMNINNSSRQEAPNQNGQHNRLILMNSSSHEIQPECRASNILYYVSALILGAYANFSKMNKLGLI